MTPTHHQNVRGTREPQESEFEKCPAVASVDRRERNRGAERLTIYRREALCSQETCPHRLRAMNEHFVGTVARVLAGYSTLAATGAAGFVAPAYRAVIRQIRQPPPVAWFGADSGAEFCRHSASGCGPIQEVRCGALDGVFSGAETESEECGGSARANPSRHGSTRPPEPGAQQPVSPQALKITL